MEVRHDNSWMLTIYVDDLDCDYPIEVNDNTSIANLRVKLIERIHLEYDWLEFGFWNESNRTWLLPKSSNLSSFSVTCDSNIHFLRRHRLVNIQLPDLQVRAFLIDFSKTVYQTNKIVCKKIGIRHHEELSFQYRSAENVLSRTLSLKRAKKRNVSSQIDTYRSLRRGHKVPTSLPIKSEINSFLRSFSISSKFNQHFRPLNLSEKLIKSSINEPICLESFENVKLLNSPELTYNQSLKNGDIFNIRDYKDRSTLRFPWLISEMNLMDQEIKDFNNVILLLRFKYHCYFYLNEQYDEIRINQIFHQAQWSVLSNETDCTEDEALVLAGIQLQVRKCIENEKTSRKKVKQIDLDQEISSVLDRLELECLGGRINTAENGKETISGIVYVRRYPKYFFNSFTKHFAEMKKDGIYLFSEGTKKLTEVIPIKGNQIELRVKPSKNACYILEIFHLQNDFTSFAKDDRGIEKYEIKFIDEKDFIRWASGCRLVAKCLDFSVPTNFQYECCMVANMVVMKQPTSNTHMIVARDDYSEINLSDFISPKFNRPFKRQYNLDTIANCQRSFRNYNSIQSKIAYIKCWLTLRCAGTYYFQVFVNKHPEKELVGIGYNGIILTNLDTGSMKRHWQYSEVVTWNTNWSLQYVILEFSKRNIFLQFCTKSDCQCFHEYLGGYLFLMMRNSGKFSDLSERTFRKLTAREHLRI